MILSTPPEKKPLSGTQAAKVMYAEPKLPKFDPNEVTNKIITNVAGMIGSEGKCPFTYEEVDTNKGIAFINTKMIVNVTLSMVRMHLSAELKKVAKKL